MASRKQTSRQAREAREKDALALKSRNNLRSPICCILGHVDTGKTLLLDSIRQLLDASEITQQIGATKFSDKVFDQDTSSFEVKIPGLLMIDTPGHKSFNNHHSRVSSVCDIAIMVINLVQVFPGLHDDVEIKKLTSELENQTNAFLKILMKNKTPFIIALNKSDLLSQDQSVNLSCLPFSHFFLLSFFLTNLS
jgi:translation initiation factor 5B